MRNKLISIFASAALVLPGAAMAADYSLPSTSADGTQLEIDYTGSNWKTLISASSSVSNGRGLALFWNTYADYSTLYGIEEYINVGQESYIQGLGANIYGGNSSSLYGANFYISGDDYGYHYGVRGSVDGDNYSQNYGVAGLAYGYNSSITYGVYGLGYDGSNAAAAAGYFDGKLYYGSLHAISDAKFKKNIRDIDGGLGKIMALKPRAYEMKVDEFKDKVVLQKGEHLGFIAQELETVLPQLVTEGLAPAHLTPEEVKNKVRKDPTAYKAVNYEGVIPVLVAAVQEQQALIESMRSEIAALKAAK